MIKNPSSEGGPISKELQAALNAIQSPKRRAFVLEYRVDKNATKAAERAGFSAKTAYSQGQRVLKDVVVAEAVRIALLDQQIKTLVDADYIITASKEVLEKSLEREPVLVRDGRETVQETVMIKCIHCEDPKCVNTQTVGVWKFDSAGANGALKLLASHVRGFHAPQKIEATGKDGEPLQVQVVKYA